MVMKRAKIRDGLEDNNDPLYSSRILLNYLDYLKNEYPDIEIDPLLDYAEITRHQAHDTGHWFTQKQVDRFHEVVVQKTGNPKIAREAGRFSVSSDRLGAAKQYALGMLSIASVYLMIGRLANAMTRGSLFEAKKQDTIRL